MIDLITHWILTWVWALYAALILGVAAIVAGFFLRAPLSWAARVIGIASLALAMFLAGYQTADGRAAHQSAVQALRNENARLARDLAVQKLVADKASEERDFIQLAIDERNKKVSDYEARIRDMEKRGSPAVASCALDDADIHALRSLRSKTRR